MSSYGSRQRQDYSEPRSSAGVLRQVSLLITGGILVGSSFVAFGIWRAGDRFLQDLRHVFNPPQPEPQVDIRSVVVDRVRQASELTTAMYAMEAVVPTSRDRTFGGYVVGRTTLLYIAHGEVRAGVDLSKIQPEDVQISDQTVTLRLPAPEILDSKIDVNRSRVYDYDRGFMGLGPDAAPQLQSLAQQETLQKIVQTACSQGLLETANQRADFAVTQLLETAGAGDRSFIVETQPPTGCTAAVPAPASEPQSSATPISPAAQPPATP